MADETHSKEKSIFTLSITGNEQPSRGRPAYRSRLMEKPQPEPEVIPEEKGEKRQWAEDKSEAMAAEIDAALEQDKPSAKGVVTKILGWWLGLSAVAAGIAYMTQNDSEANSTSDTATAITQSGENASTQVQTAGQGVGAGQEGESFDDETNASTVYITQNVEGGIRQGTTGCAMPVFSPRTLSLNDIPSKEYNGHINLLNGLQGTPGLSTWIDREMAYAITTNLQNDMSLSEAIEQGKKDTLSWIDENYRRDAAGRPDGNGFWLHSRTIGSQMACVRAEAPFMTNAVRFRSRVAEANLAGYNEAQALNMLNTFGGLILDPELGRHATEEAQKDPEAMMDRQRIVLKLTAKLIESGRMSSHEALCTAVKKTRVHEDRPSPSDFFVYAQTDRIMTGKNRAEQVAALRAEDERIEADRHGWFYRHAGTLLVLSAIGFVGFKVKEWHDSTR